MKLKKPNKLEVLLMVLLLATISWFGYVLAGEPFSAQSKLNNQNIDWDSYNFPEVSQINMMGDFRDTSNFFKTLAEEKGGEYAFRTLAKAAYLNNLPPNIDSHLLGHTVGDVLYEQEKKNGIKYCTDDLRNACSHSIVVGSLLEEGLEALKDIVFLCNEAPGGTGAYNMCVHGLGHGVLAYAEYEFEQAMKICDTIGTSEKGYKEVGECVGGATMEMVAGVHDKEAWEKQIGDYFSKDDVVSPCNKDYVPASGKTFCYTYLTPHLMKEAGISLGNPDPALFPKAMALCDQIEATDASSRSTCFASFGKEFTVLANSRNVQSITELSNEKLLQIYSWCSSSGIEEATGPCLGSVLGSLYWGGENPPDVSLRFCNVIPDENFSDKCSKNLVNTVRYYVADRGYRENICSQIDAEVKEYCRETLLN